MHQQHEWIKDVQLYISKYKYVEFLQEGILGIISFEDTTH